MNLATRPITLQCRSLDRARGRRSSCCVSVVPGPADTPPDRSPRPPQSCLTGAMRASAHEPVTPPHQIPDQAPSDGAIDPDADLAAISEIRRVEEVLGINQKLLQADLRFDGDARPAPIEFAHREGLSSDPKVGVPQAATSEVPGSDRQRRRSLWRAEGVMIRAVL